MHLVPLPKDMKIIGSMWIFRVKKLPNNIFHKRKSRVVAKGYYQSLSFDFSKTSSPWLTSYHKSCSHFIPHKKFKIESTRH